MATPLRLSQYELGYPRGKWASFGRFGNLRPFIRVAGQKLSDSFPNMRINDSGIGVLGRMRVQETAMPGPVGARLLALGRVPVVGTQWLLNSDLFLPRQCLGIDDSRVPPVGDQATGELVTVFVLDLESGKLIKHAPYRHFVKRFGRHGRASAQRIGVEMPRGQVMNHVTTPYVFPGSPGESVEPLP
jgi:hypothetical protein